MSPTVRRRIAVNPIPYWSKAGKTKEVFEEAFADFAKIGYTAVKADVPDGIKAQEYAAWIGSYGLAPAISLFSSPFDETIDIADEVERAKRFAGTQVELGLDRTMISSMAIPARLAQPALGADFSRDRLSLAIENCGTVCEVLQSEGLRPLHHSHVGGVFEIEEEIVMLLDELGPDLIGFGPDTGHLRWVGIEPAILITRYADRLGGIHIKDVFPDHLGPHQGEPAGRSYHELAASKQLWCEPGRGVVDFDAVLKALPEDYDGDFMIEIDEPSVESRFESHQIAYQWARQNLPA